MRRTTSVTLILTCAWAGSATAQAPDGHAQAAQTFRSQCLSCHQPPDLTFHTDVAWLDQVNRTG